MVVDMPLKEIFSTAQQMNAYLIIHLLNNTQIIPDLSQGVKKRGGLVIVYSKSYDYAKTIVIPASKILFIEILQEVK